MKNNTAGVREREDANRTREAGNRDEVEGVVANTLNGVDGECRESDIAEYDNTTAISRAPGRYCFFCRSQTWKIWPFPGVEVNSVGRGLPAGAKQTL